MHIDVFSWLLYDTMFVYLFCNKSIKTVHIFFWLTSVATWCSRKDELLWADCLWCGCFIDWDWSHASKSYMVSFVSFTSGKRTLESCAKNVFPLRERSLSGFHLLSLTRTSSDIHKQAVISSSTQSGCPASSWLWPLWVPFPQWSSM